MMTRSTLNYNPAARNLNRVKGSPNRPGWSNELDAREDRQVPDGLTSYDFEDCFKYPTSENVFHEGESAVDGAFRRAGQ
jgi:hypothetical protein